MSGNGTLECLLRWNCRGLLCFRGWSCGIRRVRDCFGTDVTAVYDSISFSCMIAARFGCCLLIAGQIFVPVQHQFFWFDSSKVQQLCVDSRADFLGQFLGCWFRVFRYIGDLCLFSLSASLLHLYTLDVNKICLF